MAITKLERLKEASGGRPAQHLQNSIRYICNPEKTGGGLYIGGNSGITPEISYHNMLRNKSIWGKEDGTQGFHYILSFSPDVKVEETTVLAIADEFCEELFQKKYYYVTAVHNDKDHMHVHIVFDSVSREDGKKFHSPQNDWNKRIQPITDKLCRKYNLPTLEYSEERKGKNYAEWRNQRNSQETKTRDFTWYDVIRDDIDEAVASVSTYPEFIQFLKDRHYTIREGQDHKYLSVKPYGRERPVRTSRLGEAYDKETIMLRIMDKNKYQNFEQRAVCYGDMKEMKSMLFIKIQKNRNWKFTPYQRAFYRRWHNTYFIRRPPGKILWKYRNEILEVTRLSECIQYLLKNDIGSQGEAEEKADELNEELQILERKSGLLRSRLYHTQSYFYARKYQKLELEFDKTGDPSILKEMEETRNQAEARKPMEAIFQEMENLKKEISSFGTARKEIRQELKMIQRIQEQFFRIQENPEFDQLHRLQISKEKTLKQERKETNYGRRDKGTERTDRGDEGRSIDRVIH